MLTQTGFLLAMVMIGQSSTEASTLNDSQKKEIASIRAQAKIEAAAHALKLAGLIARANENMLADEPDEKISKTLGDAIRSELHEILDIKLRVTKRSLKVLNTQQRAALRQEQKKPGAPGDLMESLIQLFKLPKD